MVGALRALPCTLYFQVTGYLATLGGRRLDVMEDDKEEGRVMYKATLYKEEGRLDRATIGNEREKESLSLCLLLNGCRLDDNSYHNAMVTMTKTNGKHLRMTTNTLSGCLH